MVDKRLWRPLFGTAALGGAFCYGFWRLHQFVPAQGPRVCLMPADCRPEEAGHCIEQLAMRPDLALWSEDATGQVIGTAATRMPSGPPLDDIIERWEQVADVTGCMFVIGCTRQEIVGSHANTYNCVAVVDPKLGYRGVYDKRFLVPWSEFIPTWRARMLGIRASARRGAVSPCFLVAKHRFAAGICYDICFPEWSFGFVDLPDFVVVAGCESIDVSFRLQRAMLQMARFRAIELRRAFVRNVELGFSGLIDGNGRLCSVPDNLFLRQPYLTGPIPIDRRLSLYWRWGDWFPLLCSLSFATSVIGLGRGSTKSVT
jgi:apolipoprotein N-acyltransferase